MDDDMQRDEMEMRETRAYNYVIANTKKRIAQIEASTLRLQFLTFFLVGVMLGAVGMDIMLHLAGHL